MRRLTLALRVALLGALLVGPFHALVPDAAAKGSLVTLEKEFRRAIGTAVPAAVVCVASGQPPAKTGLGSSGVIITKSGYVLSDGDAGAYADGDSSRQYSKSVDVRVPNLAEGGFRSYVAKVVRRHRSVDTCLLKIENPPLSGFDDFLVPASAAHLQVGDYNFVTGNSFGGGETPPATTAGVIASKTYLPANDGGGRFEFLFTSAAVNPGVNGGPVVDVEGRLVGTVSTFMTPLPGQPYQFLGKVVPIDRIRAAFSDLPNAKSIFPDPGATKDRAKEAAALEAVFRAAGHAAYPFVVSLDIERNTPLSTLSPGAARPPRGQAGFQVPRYLGPFSGILVDGDGHIVTSLANVTNVAPLLFAGWKAPAEAAVETGIRAVSKVNVHFSDGRTAVAKVVGYDVRLGVVLLRAELPAPTGNTVAARPALKAAPPEVYREGRFVVAVGNPFGKAGNPDPLLAVGVLSKYHVETVRGVWRGQWQTDAAATDANCGGALVDLRGRVVGMLQVWSPLMFGRNSGIGFVVPWERILGSIPFLKEGRAPAYMGVKWKQGADATIGVVVPKSPAAEAGLQVGDTIVGVDDLDTPGIAAVAGALAGRWAGEKAKLRVKRGRKELKLEIVFGTRP